MEINVNKEICSYKEAVFFGLTTRQFVWVCETFSVK